MSTTTDTKGAARTVWHYPDPLTVFSDPHTQYNLAAASQTFYSADFLRRLKRADPDKRATMAESTAGKLVVPYEIVKGLFKAQVDSTDDDFQKAFVSESESKRSAALSDLQGKFRVSMEAYANERSVPTSVTAPKRSKGCLTVHDFDFDYYESQLPHSYTDRSQLEWNTHSKPIVMIEPEAESFRNGIKSIAIHVANAMTKTAPDGSSVSVWPMIHHASAISTRIEHFVANVCHYHLKDLVRGRCSKETAEAAISSMAEAVVRLATVTDSKCFQPSGGRHQPFQGGGAYPFYHIKGHPSVSISMDGAIPWLND